MSFVQSFPLNNWKVVIRATVSLDQKGYIYIELINLWVKSFLDIFDGYLWIFRIQTIRRFISLFPKICLQDIVTISQQ